MANIAILELQSMQYPSLVSGYPSHFLTSTTSQESVAASMAPPSCQDIKLTRLPMGAKYGKATYHGLCIRHSASAVAFSNNTGFCEAHLAP